MPKLPQILQSRGLCLLQHFAHDEDGRSEQEVTLEMSVFERRLEQRLNLERVTLENYRKTDKLEGLYEQNT